MSVDCLDLQLVSGFLGQRVRQIAFEARADVIRDKAWSASQTSRSLHDCPQVRSADRCVSQTPESSTRRCDTGLTWISLTIRD